MPKSTFQSRTFRSRTFVAGTFAGVATENAPPVTTPTLSVEDPQNQVIATLGTYDFGSVILGTVVEGIFTLINVGDGDLTIPQNGITVVDDTTLETNPSTAGAIVLSPLEELELTVVLDTGSVGSKTGRLEIVSDDSESPYIVNIDFEVEVLQDVGGSSGANKLKMTWVKAVKYMQTTKA